MSHADVFADRSQLMADLNMIETFRWYRMVFTERLTAASKSQDEDILEMLRLEATYQLAEFYYGLKAHGIENEKTSRSWPTRTTTTLKVSPTTRPRCADWAFRKTACWMPCSRPTRAPAWSRSGASSRAPSINPTSPDC